VHSGSTTLRVTLVPVLGGEELVGEVQLSPDFFDLLTFVNSFYVGSGSRVHSTGSTTLRVRLVSI
jgi:hypothetical protein